VSLALDIYFAEHAKATVDIAADEDAGTLR
jgi:hypothetical protein